MSPRINRHKCRRSYWHMHIFSCAHDFSNDAIQRADPSSGKINRIPRCGCVRVGYMHYKRILTRMRTRGIYRVKYHRSIASMEKRSRGARRQLAKGQKETRCVAKLAIISIRILRQDKIKIFAGIRFVFLEVLPPCRRYLTGRACEFLGSWEL